MKNAFKLLSAVLAIIMIFTVFSSCSKKIESTKVNINDFRVTAYVLADGLRDMKKFDSSNLKNISDIILFGCAKFDEKGNVTLDDDFATVLSNLIIATNADPDKKIFLNLLGPDSQSKSDNWNEQMTDKAQRHNNAFNSKKLEQSIKKVLDDYKFDGIFFDYEFPIKNKNWKIYSNFLVSLDSVLGDKYQIGMALAGWDLKLSDQAKAVTDRIEIMSYDLWDDDGNHATYDIAKDDIEKFEKAGYDKAKLDLGVPFYARPTTGEEYWYDYNNYADKIDKNGLYKDEKTKLTFSFNTPDLIKKKTQLTIESGCGGMMVWHYSCDSPAKNSNSLFGAIQSQIKEAQNAK